MTMAQDPMGRQLSTIIEPKAEAYWLQARWATMLMSLRDQMVQIWKVLCGVAMDPRNALNAPAHLASIG